MCSIYLRKSNKVSRYFLTKSHWLVLLSTKKRRIAPVSGCAKFRNRILLLHFDLYHIQFWVPTTNIRGNGFESDTYVRHKYLHQSVIPLSSSSYIFYSFSVAMFSNAIPILIRIVVVYDGTQYFHSYNLYAHCPVWYLYFLYTFGNSIEPGFCLYLTVVLVLWCIYLVNTGK